MLLQSNKMHNISEADRSCMRVLQIKVDCIVAEPLNAVEIPRSKRFVAPPPKVVDPENFTHAHTREREREQPGSSRR